MADRPAPPRNAAAHIRALDGLRGVAILMVVGFHSNSLGPDQPPAWPLRVALGAGWSGVDLFFVLSGFLITGILLDSRGARGYFRAFYARRALRILPLYYAFLAGVLWLWPAVARLDPIQVRILSANQGWLWSFTANLRVALSGSFESFPLKMGHVWSLAVEEQFYLLWPLVVGLCPGPILRRVCVGLLLTAPVLRAAMLGLGVNACAGYVLTPTRFDALAAGALVALAWREPRLFSAFRRWAPSGLLASGGVLLVLIARYHRLSHLDPGVQGFGYSALAVGFGSLIVLLLASPPEAAMQRLLSGNALVLCGRYSYAMYLFGDPLSLVLGALGVSADVHGRFAILGQLRYTAASLAITFACAFVSWHALEKHFLGLKRFFPYDRATVGGPG